MTNVDTTADKPNTVDKKVVIGYLTAIFPRRYAYAERLAKRLNDKQKTSITGQPYSSNIVRQVKDKGYQDLNVEPELVAMVEEYTGKPISEACPEYVTAA